jgi:hypothetical protein
MENIDVFLYRHGDEKKTNLMIENAAYILGKLSDILHLAKNDNMLDNLMGKITKEEYYENDKKLDIEFYNKVKNFLLKD